MRFLIVEDEFVSRQLLRKLLSFYGDCDVAIDGAEAMEAIRFAWKENNPYQLVTLDILMPNLDGQATLKSIRNEEETLGITGKDGVKIVMTTSLTDSKNVLSAFRSGCEAYLTKPINRQQLEEKLKDLGIVKE